MAKKTNDAKFNYKAEVKALRDYGPERLYFLWGPEDYLREQFAAEIRKVCLPEGEDSFSYKLIDGASLDFLEFRDAVDALPFMTERSLVEVRDAKLNHLAEGDKYIQLFSDIPDYCTVVFVQSAQYEPDNRLKVIKALKEKGRELHFTKQSQGALVDWIIRRFAACGKAVELEAAQRLMFISGELMSGLIPEIEKVAALHVISPAELALATTLSAFNSSASISPALEASNLAERHTPSKDTSPDELASACTVSAFNALMETSPALLASSIKEVHSTLSKSISPLLEASVSKASHTIFTPFISPLLDDSIFTFPVV